MGERSDEEFRAQSAERVTLTGLLFNIGLTVIKFVAAILGRSGAMMADAIHSLSDFITDLVVLISFRIVRKPADDDHDYGHGKFETLASVFIGISLIAVGVGIFYSGAEKIYTSLILGKILNPPGWIALAAAFVSVLVKEWLYRYTIITGKEIRSQAVIANAWHHRSDAFSSLGTLVGIGGAILMGEKWRILDPLAAMGVSIFIIAIAWRIFRRGISELLEESLSEETKAKIMEIVERVEGVIEPHDLRTRQHGSKIIIDIHIRVKNETTIEKAHNINNVIEERLRREFGSSTMITIHTEPENE